MDTIADSLASFSPKAFVCLLLGKLGKGSLVSCCKYFRG